MSRKQETFGQILREKRVAMGLSLRKFAELIEVSPTYLSQVEQNKVESPPTADRLKRMAKVLGENVDEFLSLGGRMSEDLPQIIQDSPTTIPELLRTTRGLTPDQIQKLVKQAKAMRDKEK